MKYLRWFYKSWGFFWRSIGIALGVVFLIIVLTLLIVQLNPVKELIADRVETEIELRTGADVEIESIRGFIPFSITLNGISIEQNGNTFQAKELRAGVHPRTFLSSIWYLNGLSIDAPQLIINNEISANNRQSDLTDTLNTSGNEAFDTEILIPSVKIENGFLSYSRDTDSQDSTFVIEDISIDLYFELLISQRFIDFNNFSMKVKNYNLPEISITGQIYNDQRFLELNAFSIQSGSNTLRFNAEADGFDILKRDPVQQLQEALYSFQIREGTIDYDLIRLFRDDMPVLNKNIFLSANGSGVLDSLNIEQFELFYGESGIRGFGDLGNLMDETAPFNYIVNIEGTTIASDDVTEFYSGADSSFIEWTRMFQLEGNVRGTSEQINGELFADVGEFGKINIEGNYVSGVHNLNIRFDSDSLDLGPISAGKVRSTNLSISGSLNASGLNNIASSDGKITFKGSDGSIDYFEYNRINGFGSWEQGLIRPQISVNRDSGFAYIDGFIDVSGNQPILSLQGDMTDWNTSSFIPKSNKNGQFEHFKKPIVDLNYNIEFQGNNLSELNGQLSVDILKAQFQDTTLGAHQFYVDINDDIEGRSAIRMTSSIFDATIQGNFRTADAHELSKSWIGYFLRRLKQEILLTEETEAETLTNELSEQEIVINASIKDLGIFNVYMNDFPEISSKARINADVRMSSDRLLLSGTLYDPAFRYNQNSVDSVVSQFTGNFRSQTFLKDFAKLDIRTEIGEFNTAFGNASDVVLDFRMDADSAFIRQEIGRFADEGTFNFVGRGTLSDTLVAFEITEFNLGNEFYTWKINREPIVSYDRNEGLTFTNFSFQNENQYIMIDGTFSDNPADSVNYRLSDVQLDYISQLVDGRIDFDGSLNGTFTTRTLTTLPTIQGDINVERLLLNNNLVGDVKLNSQYESSGSRFNTKIEIRTDSSKYPEYFEGDDRSGQNITIDGYIKAPVEGQFPQADSLYAFDLNFKNIDMWILPLIGPKVFTESAGKSSGQGKFWGSLETYDFNVDFLVGTTDAVYFRPEFLDTYYYAQGPISFNRSNGLVFNDIFLIDPSGGRAVLSGYYDLNDFQPVSYMDIRIDMDEFQFLNSEFDPSLPFFGKAYGTATVVIQGNNLSPTLRTLQPMQVSDLSRIGIPLLEETELEQNNKFIQFVDNFELSENSRVSKNNGTTTGNGNNARDPSDLTFAERFTLDLQFRANDPMTVDLVFDPVTGDQITAQGTGRLRIRLEDQDVSMFGRFNITDGRYQFVSGDIFTRRFQLDPGGTIIWEGAPDDARLDLNAVYRARPDINTLTRTRSEIDPENSQRVPVELVLNIGGTLSSIENNFFFRLPETLDPGQSGTLATQLQSLNRNEDEKLIQATSFLLMGDFIPTTTSGAAQGSLLSENISGSAAVLNPLLSNQVISPLLSSQINSLLNSDLSSLDVDFNLNTYNQVDLGVALRLYNDKLILRREGQITGRQSNIGDLGATYRINRTFSVTAFHRQDPTFGDLTGSQQSQQSQDINGVGIEAQLGFNTWKNFFGKITSPFRRLFGVKEKQENNNIE